MSEPNSMSQTKSSTSGQAEDADTTKEWQRRYNSSDKGKARNKAYKERHPKRTWAAHARENAKRRARKNNIPFDLSSAYIYSILVDKCPVFGTPFVFHGNKVLGPESPSIDRIVPEKGYVEGNIVVVSLKANQIKNAYGLDDIKRVVAWMEEQGY